MHYLRFEENNDEYYENEVSHDQVFDEIKLALSSELSKQEKYIEKFKNAIINISKNKETPSELDKLFSTFSGLVEYLGITFCELIKKDEELLDILFDLLLKENMTDKIEDILFNIIKIYNYPSDEKNFGDIIKDKLYQGFLNLPSQEKRNSKTIIEKLVDEINAFSSKMNDPIKGREKDCLQSSFEELEFNVNCLCAIDNYPPATSEFFSIEINKLKDVFLLSEKNIYAIKRHEKEINGKENINKLINPINNLNNVDTDLTNIKKEEGTSINNNQSEKELKNIQNIALKNRTFFFYKEKLLEGEDQFTEFKDYSLDDPHLSKELIRQYLGFLNSEGGNIYIGITDLKEVVGINLNYKESDIKSRMLVGLTKDFYPKVRLEKIKVFFIPIKNLETNKYIDNLFVIKIEILPGDPAFLYTVGNSKQGMISAIRHQTEVFNLTIDEMQNEIKRRNQLNNLWLGIINNPLEYIVPQIVGFERENFNEEEQKLDSKNDVKIAVVKKFLYKLKINNIDKNLKIKDINRQFNSCGCKIRKFKGKNGKSNGEGYLIFDDEARAWNIMEELEMNNLGGKTELIMKIEKI